MATAKQRLEFVHGDPDDHGTDVVNAVKALDMMGDAGNWTDERLANTVAHFCGGHHIVMLQMIEFLLKLFGDNRQVAVDALAETFDASK
jgi:hypothetical protein